MPANRSRTAGWRKCLRQVKERKGALEIAVIRDYGQGDGDGRHLVWRVRLVDLTDDAILVEQPGALGRTIQLEPGIELVAMLAVGQNRWTFTTTNLGPVAHRINDHRSIEVLRLAMPQTVERCQRRNYFRMETSGLNLPEVEMWPLLDPKSVLLAERANELQIQADGSRQSSGDTVPADDATMPEVGPRFTATLLNIGGGGVGLRVRPQDAQALGRHKLFWLRFALPPELATPICATGKLAHTNVDSTQHTYAGMAFDFSFNPAHQGFVVEQICRYIRIQQKDQLGQQRQMKQAG